MILIDKKVVIYNVKWYSDKFSCRNCASVLFNVLQFVIFPSDTFLRCANTNTVRVFRSKQSHSVVNAVRDYKWTIRGTLSYSEIHLINLMNFYVPCRCTEADITGSRHTKKDQRQRSARAFQLHLYSTEHDQISRHNHRHFAIIIEITREATRLDPLHACWHAGIYPSARSSIWQHEIVISSRNKAEQASRRRLSVSSNRDNPRSGQCCCRSPGETKPKHCLYALNLQIIVSVLETALIGGWWLNTREMLGLSLHLISRLIGE